MLYVGFTERPFTALKLAVTGQHRCAVPGRDGRRGAVPDALGTQHLCPARTHGRHDAAGSEAGRLEARVGPLESRDEIGELALTSTTCSTPSPTTRAPCSAGTPSSMPRWPNGLQALEQAQQQLVRSEKLAAVGQLTASIAHEVNNPIAVIQGNLDLVRELLGNDTSKVQGELRLVDEQIERMRLIVTRLLQFARPNEFAGYVEAVNVSEALDDRLLLVGHLLAKTRITVERRFRAQRRPAINRHELQQVIVNLLVNATQAMPDGGTLTLSTRDADDADAVRIEVADTGPGLGAALVSPSCSNPSSRARRTARDSACRSARASSSATAARSSRPIAATAAAGPCSRSRCDASPPSPMPELLQHVEALRLDVARRPTSTPPPRATTLRAAAPRRHRRAWTSTAGRGRGRNAAAAPGC